MIDRLFHDGRPGFFAFRYPEYGAVAVLAAFSILFASITGAPFVVPDWDNTGFIGLRYSFPLGLGAAWLGLTMVVHKRRIARGEDRGAELAQNRRFATQAIGYFITFSAVLWLHFNLKLWGPLINPRLYDDAYYCIDRALAPILLPLTEFRAWLSGYTNEHIDSWYLLTFAFMFFLSFAYHVFRHREGLRKVFLAILFIETLGPLSYHIAPAAGPFIFENSPSLLAYLNQSGMWEIRSYILTQGSSWIALNGDRFLSVGLAAMPSLHAGASYIFVHYAVKYRTPLLPAYIVMFGWILIEAMAAKWHYFIDLPVGIALALFCIWAAERFCAAESTSLERPEGEIRSSLT